MRRTSRHMVGAVRAYDLSRGADQPVPDYSVPDLIQFVEVIGDLSAVNRPAREPNHFACQLSRTPTVGQRAIFEIRAGSRPVSVTVLHLQQALGALLFSQLLIDDAVDVFEVIPSYAIALDPREVRFFIGDRTAALPGNSQYTISPDIPLGPFVLPAGGVLAVSSIAVTNPLTASVQVVEYAP